jgi:error-prone DNA polymerase
VVNAPPEHTVPPADDGPPPAPGLGDYVELHCRSAFSLLAGAALPEQLVARAAAVGLGALALTDRHDLGGVVRFAHAAREAHVEALVGAEVDVAAWPGDADDAPPTPLVLLAESREGYGHVSTLVGRARMDRDRGRPCVPFALLAAHAAGVHALTGGPRGRVPAHVARADHAGARAALGLLADAFAGRVAVECWHHGLPEERALVRALVPLARSAGVPWVVTNDVRYAEPAQRAVHDVLAALRHGRTLDAMGTRLHPNGEWYLKGPAAMRRAWRHAPAGLRASVAIAERCTFRMAQLRPTLPAFALPPGVSADAYLRELVATGAAERWGDAITERHHRQLAHELGMIRRLGLAGYFLIVWDIVRFARREGILCQGRGSAANSAVCYCLGITAVDPIAMELLFERFLSEERQEAPDIDLDFAHRERERVIQYVYARYGREHAAMVCEQITWRGRSAVRDAARVLGFSVQQADALSAFSDRFSAQATAAALREAAAAGGGTVGRDDASPGTVPDGGPPLRSDAATGGEMVGHDRTAHGGGASGGGPPHPERPAPPSPPAPGAPDAAPEPPHARRDAEKRRRAAEAERLGGALVRGTEATTRAAAVKRESRRLTASDRPHPNAAYEPYGSPNAQHVTLDAARPAPLDARRSTPPSSRTAPTSPTSPPTPSRRAPEPPTQEPTTILTRAGLDPADRRVRLLADVVDGLHQAPRHRSIHVGGFVLTGEPLASVVPIEPAAMPGRTVIQWEKDDLDPVRLVKIDLLGLGMLTLLQDCLKYVRLTRGIALDLATLPMDDPAVYDMLGRADTIGVFQVESRAQQNTLPRLRPRCFYDLVVEVALIRPGPIQGDMVHPYLRRRAGTEPVTYPHPSLEPILRRTLGVPLFQEQGMQVAVACAGFSPGEADELRRAMGHKRSRERMAELCERLVAGMARNGIPAETAVRIYNQINAFADYGFPESHAASFALLVYASAYLKHYYGPEFLCAMLNAQPMGFYAPGTLIEDARRHGVHVLPVDVTRSAFDSTLEVDDAGCGMRDAGCVTAEPFRIPHPASGPPEPPAVRLGLRLIRGLGSRARERLERAVTAGGSFTALDDLVARAGLDRRALRVLAEAGALDAFVAEEPVARRRRAAVWRLLEAVRGPAGPLAPTSAARPVPAAVPPMSPYELTAADYRVTGALAARPPHAPPAPAARPNGVRTARDLVARRATASRVAVAGLVICRQRPGTAKGFVFLTLEDETGTINVVVRRSASPRRAAHLDVAAPPRPRSAAGGGHTAHDGGERAHRAGAAAGRGGGGGARARARLPVTR